MKNRIFENIITKTLVVNCFKNCIECCTLNDLSALCALSAILRFKISCKFMKIHSLIIIFCNACLWSLSKIFQSQFALTIRIIGKKQSIWSLSIAIYNRNLLESAHFRFQKYSKLSHLQKVEGSNLLARRSIPFLANCRSGLHRYLCCCRRWKKEKKVKKKKKKKKERIDRFTVISRCDWANGATVAYFSGCRVANETP